MSRIVLACSFVLAVSLASSAAHAQEVSNPDLFTTCPYSLGTGATSEQVYVGIETGASFDETALKAQVVKIAQGIKKGKLKPECALKDGKWKLRKNDADAVRLFWWVNATRKSFGWIATKKVEDRVFILKSNAARAWVNANEVHDKSTFKISNVGGITHRLVILVQFAKPGDIDPNSKILVGQGGFDYYYAIKIVTR